jgi:hypothetical protein
VYKLVLVEAPSKAKPPEPSSPATHGEFQMDRIELSDHGIFEQSPKSASDLLRNAIQEIDRVFGSGYAQNNPDLVGSFMAAASMDYAVGIIAKRLERISDRLDRFE